MSILNAMKYAHPLYTIQEVNRAGRQLLPSSSEHDAFLGAMDVIDNWRASHAYPTQSIYITLKRQARLVYADALVAQRIKRLPSIVSKLNREHEMKLSQMQDIGGCRAVFQTIQQVRELEANFKAIKWQHEALAPKDYIANPKTSGYRGVHLKYRYGGGKDKYKGLKVEIQLRTLLQHMWATAVEAVDIFSGQALKSSMGRAEWQRFFALMSSVFALREGCPAVSGTAADLIELALEIQQLDSKYHMATALAGYTAILPRVDRSTGDSYFLVTLDPVALTLHVKGFKKNESQLATTAYTNAEKSLIEGSPTQVVLVSISSITALKRVYPNYFMDTSMFVNQVNHVLTYGVQPDSTLGGTTL